MENKPIEKYKLELKELPTLASKPYTIYLLIISISMIKLRNVGTAMSFFPSMKTWLV